MSLDGVSAHCPIWVHTTAWTGSPTVRPFIPADVAKKSTDQIEKWAEDCVLRLLDLCAELGVKIVPMFWGVAFGWELATGYPWGFWADGDYDLVKEGKARFVKKTAKIRQHANKFGIYLCHEIHPGTAAMCADDFNMLVSICDGTRCHTRAITAPFQLDARRCISYLTIELKGSIPEEFRRAIGNRIFGCDDCLAACPWNRFAQEGAIMKQHVRADLSAPELIQMLSLDETGFKAKFAGTPLYRTKRRGVLRNVCVALGNTGDERCLPALNKAAQDPEPLIAEHAQWAIKHVQERCGSLVSRQKAHKAGWVY